MNILLILNLVIVVVSVSGIDPRIINGQEARERQFPYQVGINFTNLVINWRCGGALIDNTWVLTAAHCTNGANYATVYLGTTERNRSKVKYTVSSKNFIQHNGLDAITAKDDIALIKIPAVTFDDYIQKIELPAISSNYSTYIGERVIASGWGYTSDSPRAPVTSKLQYAFLKVIDNSICIRSYESKTIRSSTLCAAPINGTSICIEDSGGPLVLEGSKILIGIISFTHKKGCESGAPSGFVRVTSYMNWIKRYTRKSN